MLALDFECATAVYNSRKSALACAFRLAGQDLSRRAARRTIAHVSDVIAGGRRCHRARSERLSCAGRAVIVRGQSCHRARAELSSRTSGASVGIRFRLLRAGRRSSGAARRATRGAPAASRCRTWRGRAAPRAGRHPPSCRRSLHVMSQEVLRASMPSSTDVPDEHRRARRLAIASNLTPSSCEITRPVTAGRSL
jgi:hypothetical protein